MATTTTQDDGFHEIQLNGKQLVFLFMAVTVILVVTFLTGMLVGRNIGVERDTLAAGLTEEPAANLGEGAAPPPPEPSVPSTAPAGGNEDLDYPRALSGANTPEPKLTPAPREERPAEPPAAPPAPAPTAPPASADAPADRPTVASAPAEPAGTGMAIQIIATRSRREADAMANRLIGKGYQAYVVTPAAGAPDLFRVRVGKFKERRQADAVVSRLKKEEKLTPWIVR